MSYTPFLIANWSTGINDRLQPWLIQEDAQQALFDGEVYRGVMSKRDGYAYFATGGKGGVPYRESRIVHTLSAVTPTAGAIDGTNRNFAFTLNPQIARGSITINGSNPVQVMTDDGNGSFTGSGVGTVDYVAGTVVITFTTAPDVASTVLLTYSFMPGNPVMMIATFTTRSNSKQCIVADTQYVNKFDPTTNTWQDISPALLYTGNSHQFFTWTNYADANSNPRLLFSNNKNVIQSYDGTTVTNYVYNMQTGTPPVNVTALTCSWMVQFKDRLILLRTSENGVIYPQRIRISGVGANCDDFRITALGAGVIDIPDGTWINGATFSFDNLLIFTEAAVWILKYTGNDAVPFSLEKIDGTRGSGAAFSAFTYLNRSSAASPRGLIMTDGYRVERQDELIPNFSFQEVDADNFDLCYAGVVDADRDHYLIYPPSGQTESKRILITNYDEDNYSIYRIPLSCMGTFFNAYDITWNDLDIYSNWRKFSAVYGSWNSFVYSQGAPLSLGGGHHGEIWSLDVNESEDNPVQIRNIVAINDGEVQVTTDWNNFSFNGDDPTMGADYIFLTAMEGMEPIWTQQFPIIEVIDENNFILNVKATQIPATQFPAYVSGGTASRVIPFSSLLKQFNPYVSQDKKVRCGWIYMYVDATETDIIRTIQIADISTSNPCVVTTAQNHGLVNNTNVTIFGVQGMTEINDAQSSIQVLTPTSFALTAIDSSAYTPYTGLGYVGAPVPAKIDIDVITNDNEEPTQLNDGGANPYQGNCTNIVLETGAKKWYKVFINQTGRFIQFKIKNTQAGTDIHIQAVMPGFQPVGRLI